MSWFKRLFGFKTAQEKYIDNMRKQIASLQKKAFDAQRNGDLRAAGEYQQKAHDIEDELIDLTTNANIDLK